MVIIFTPSLFPLQLKKHHVLSVRQSLANSCLETLKDQITLGPLSLPVRLLFSSLHAISALTCYVGPFGEDTPLATTGVFTFAVTRPTTGLQPLGGDTLSSGGVENAPPKSSDSGASSQVDVSRSTATGSTPSGTKIFGQPMHATPVGATYPGKSCHYYMRPHAHLYSPKVTMYRP